ncbi:MAG TPA: ChaN family lipoprotein [Roseivirga sp.]
MKRFLLSLCFLLFVATLAAQNNGPYVIYNSKGKKVSYKKMMKHLAAQDVVFFGELHNNPIAHWLQLEVTTELQQSRKLILGAEMMEADNQDELDDYLAGRINQKALDTLARLWNNYKTDYKPLIDFAKANELRFIATNIPRKYASMVNKDGFEALEKLSAEEKSWIAPQPFPYDADLPRYVNILDMMAGHGTPNLVKAQASKDATMAHFIATNYSPGSLFIHYNGSYHTSFHEGILWYLTQYKPGLKTLTITTVEQADISQLDSQFLNEADFIICVDKDMTKTY